MDLLKVKSNFERNNFGAKVFNNAAEAANYLCHKIKNKTVGFGDSDTLMKMELFEKLSESNRVYSPAHLPEGKTFDEIAHECLTKEIFITSVNAVSETGEMVNLDGTGNRIAGSLFGHEKVYFIIGKNKIEQNLESAIFRAKNIAAPKNAKRYNLKTPCAIKGDKCYNCSSPERICNAMTIYYKAVNDTAMKMEAVLIDEELGF
ncbi:MAG: lactate utilization protein [Anaerovoracaceae bacterium]